MHVGRGVLVRQAKELGALQRRDEEAAEREQTQDNEKRENTNHDCRSKEAQENEAAYRRVPHCLIA